MIDYKDWVPIKLWRENGAVKVRGGFCGGLRFTEPFFDESVRKSRFPFSKYPKRQIGKLFPITGRGGDAVAQPLQG
jgi:hypothetical protein